MSDDVPVDEMEKREAEDQSCFQASVSCHSGRFRGITDLLSYLCVFCAFDCMID